MPRLYPSSLKVKWAPMKYAAKPAMPAQKCQWASATSPAMAAKASAQSPRYTAQFKIMGGTVAQDSEAGQWA